MDDISNLGTGEALFEYLSHHHHNDLADIIKNNALMPCDLTFAAEYLGVNCADSKLVRETLVPLLEHPDASVREGALYGLNSHYNYTKGEDHIDEPTENIIRKMAVSDPSPCIRQIAKAIIEDDS